MDATGVGKLAGRRNASSGEVGCTIGGLEWNSAQRDPSRFGLRVRDSFHAPIIHLSRSACRVGTDGPGCGNLSLFYEVRVGLWQSVTVPRTPNVQRRQQENAHDEGGH